MSIVRVGLAETKRFGEGYEAIFGKKSTTKRAAKPPKRKAMSVRKAKRK
jgi:hypothetical protein